METWLALVVYCRFGQVITKAAAVVYGLCGPIIVPGENSWWSLLTNQNTKRRYSQVISNQSYHTVQYGDFLFVYTVPPGDYSTNISQSSMALSYYGGSFLSSSQLLSSLYTPFSTFPSCTHCGLLRYLPSSGDVCSSTSVLHLYILLQVAPAASCKVFGKELGPLDGIVSWCVAVTVHNESMVITFPHITHTTIDGIFPLRVCEFFCSSFSSASAYTALSVVDWLVCLYTFCRPVTSTEVTSVDQSIETSSQIPRLTIVIFVGNTSIIEYGHILGASVGCTTQSTDALRQT